LIAEERKPATAPRPAARWRQIPWIRLALSLALSGLGLWYVTRDASLVDIGMAIHQATLGYVALGLVVIVATMLIKAWRWQLLFHPPATRPRFRHLFWALSLGQLVNTAVPFLRLGEIARIYDLGEQSDSSRALALGTLVVEKVVDMMMLVLTIALLLPFLVIPDFVVDSSYVAALAAVFAIVALLLLAFRPDVALRLMRLVLRPLPDRFEARLLPIVAKGLEGLSSLRNARATLFVLLISAFIAFLSVLTPYVLFLAFSLPLGLVAAASLHVVLTVGSLPPSTPAKVGVFEFLVAFMLRFFGVENSSLILAYTVIFHLVVVVPQLLFGTMALARGKGRNA
jgi:uncharacterized protein (TIRG00374 family)